MYVPFMHSRGCHGVILFLSLLALAMVQMTLFVIFLPLFFFAVVAYALPMLEYATGYLSVALTICKNE